MNILKTLKIDEPDFFKHAISVLELHSVFDSFIKHGNRFFTVKSAGKHILLTPVEPAIDYLHALQTLQPLLSSQYLAMLLELKQPKRFSLTHKNSILTFAFLDLILVLKTIKSNTEAKEQLLNYLCLHTQSPELRNKVDRVYSREKSTVYLPNRDSSIIHLLVPKQSKRTIKIGLENQTLVKASPLLSFIEVSKDIDNAKLSAFLVAFNAISGKVLALMSKEGHTLSDGLKFGLRLRKIKHTHKRGFFISEQNTIVLDPRHTDSITHEVGHWYHTHFRKDIQTTEDCEKFASLFLA